jgi:hypothetical protein
MPGKQLREVVLLELGDMPGTAGKEPVASVGGRIGSKPASGSDDLVRQIVDAKQGISGEQSFGIGRSVSPRICPCTIRFRGGPKSSPTSLI